MIWRSVKNDPPASGRWVLVRGPSNWQGIRFFYAAAKWHWNAAREVAIWKAGAMDNLSDYGYTPLEWTELPDDSHQ